MFHHYDYYHDLLFSFNFDIITIIVIVVVIVINTACPLQATSQVFALVPVGSQEYGRQRGHLMNVLPPVDTYSFTCHGQVFYLQYKSQPEEWV